MSSPSQIERDLKNTDHIAKLMDAAFRIPGTQIKLGWDSLIGLVPGVGDIVTAIPLFYFLTIGWKHKIPKRILLVMIARQIVDTLIGSIPIVGDIFDVAYRANQKNAHTLRDALTHKLPRIRNDEGGGRLI